MENKIPKHLLEVGECFEQKYQPVLNYEEWLVAMLRQIPKTAPENLCQVERHNLTNEVFILTEGEADLIVADNGNSPSEFYAFPMRKNVAYNFPKSVWHHVVMTKEAHIILIEKSNTSIDNSDYYTLNEEDLKNIKLQLRKMFR